MFKRFSLIFIFVLSMLLMEGNIAEAASSFPTDVKNVTGKDEIISVADYGAKYIGVEWTNASGTKKKVIAYCRKASKETPPKSGASYTSYIRGTKADDYIVSNGYPTKSKGDKIGGFKTTSNAEAMLITQGAAWLAGNPNMTKDSMKKHMFGSIDDAASYPNGLKIINAAYSLYNSAVNYKNSTSTKYNGASYIVYPNNDKYQPLLVGVFFEEGKITLTKRSSNTSISNSSSSYSIAGAIYNIYSNAACTTKVGSMTTNASGVASYSPLPRGTYYVKEQNASAGFYLDTSVHTATVSTAGQNVTIVSDENPITGRIQVSKRNNGSNLLSGWSGSYTISGAQYQVRNSAGTVMDTITTNASGIAISKELPIGSYTIKESKAPNGYKVDGKTYTSTISAGGTTQAKPSSSPVSLVSSPETPILITPPYGAKNDADAIRTGRAAGAQGGADLSAVYEISYYDALYSSVIQATGSPKWTKRFTTSPSANGTWNITIPQAEKFADGAGGYGWGVGSYIVREVETPDGYLVSAPVMFRIEANGSYNLIAGSTLNGGALSASNPYLLPETIKRGDIDVLKLSDAFTDDGDETDAALTPGISFDIVNMGESAVMNVETLEWIEPGEVVYTITTDKNGIATTRDIPNNSTTAGEAPGRLPYGKYLLKEVSSTTPIGYKPASDYPFTISENGEVHEAVIENHTGTVVKIVKKDIDTGKIVPGKMRFSILDENGELVRFKNTAGDIETVICTDDDGTARLPRKLLMGTYYLSEVEAPNGYLHNADKVMFEVNSSTVNTYDDPLAVEMKDTAAKGKIRLTKRDKETGDVITRGTSRYEIIADEKITTADGTVRMHEGASAGFIDISEGVGESGELYLGKYILREVQAPIGYAKSSKEIPVEISYEDDRNDVADKLVTVEAQAYDESVLGSLRIDKIDADTKESISVAGAKFDIIAVDDIIGGDGHIWHRAGEKVTETQTDGYGAASVDGLRIGRYKAVETVAPYGYARTETATEFEISYEGEDVPHVSTAISIENELMANVPETWKLDAETGRPVLVKGCVLSIYADEDIKYPNGDIHYPKGTRVGDMVTDESGKALHDLALPCGKYVIRENAAPYGYALSYEEIYWDASWDNGTNPYRIFSIDYSDYSTKGKISFCKSDASTGAPIKVPGIEASVYADGDIIRGDGSVVYSDGQEVAHLVTGADGTAETEELPLGTYRVVETRAPEGYLVNPNDFSACLAYKGQIVPIVSTNVLVHDENAMGMIEIDKIDDTSGSLIQSENAVFTVRAAEDIITLDGTVRAHNGDIVDLINIHQGKGTSKPLFLGAYSIEETQAPDGYVRDSRIYRAVLSYKDQTTPLVSVSQSIENSAQKGVISVTKVDSETGKTVLRDDAKFEIRAAEDIVTPDGNVRASKGDIVDRIATNVDGIATSRALHLGKYEIYETNAPNGYLLSDEVKTVELRYGDQNEPLVYDIESIYDTPVRGTISVHKEDSDLAELLPNVEYEIRAADDIVGEDGTSYYDKGALVQTMVTDESGEAISDLLPLGKYIVVETVQPNGYELDTTEYPVELQYQGDSVPVVHENVFLYNTPSKISLEKVSAEDNETIVPGTLLAAWQADCEVFNDRTLGIYSDEVEIVEAEIYLIADEDAGNNGEAINLEVEEDQLSQEGDRVFFTSTETLSQGNYLLVASYRMQNGANGEIKLPFSMNEYDEHAFFCIGAKSSNCVRTNIARFSNPIDENVKIESDISDENLSDILIERVPVLLSEGTFSIVKTDVEGRSEFTHVPQGKIGFAEYKAQDGYVSNRTPQYVQFREDGTSEMEIIENKENDEGDSTIIRFTDTCTKLRVSKKDITTGDELPGNTLSIYKYEENGKNESNGNDSDAQLREENYGDLVATWVSENEPHYIELLPQGTYILKEEQAVDGYTVAESIKFRINDTGIEHKVEMINSPAPAPQQRDTADELIESGNNINSEISDTGIINGIIIAAITMMLSVVGILLMRKQR